MDTVSAQEALSGASGSVSLVAWVCVLLPQLIENYKTASADGVSLAFLAVWFIGDIANLIGAVWANLVPTVIALAIYFCFADAVLISQCLYYRYRCPVPSSPPNAISQDDASQPLLTQARNENIGLPGSRRSSAVSCKRRDSASGQNKSHTSLEGKRDLHSWIKKTLCVIAVFIVGVFAWVIALQLGIWKPANQDDSAPQPTGAIILGYLSAVCYLGARIPQIAKNFREKSCEGLSLLFFILSLIGNLTYGGGILFHSVEAGYILTNLPWLIGSLGTMGEDTVIFMQFRIYATKTTNDDETTTRN